MLQGNNRHPPESDTLSIYFFKPKYDAYLTIFINSIFIAYTVSMKFFSVRLKMIMPMNNVININTAL